MKSVFMLLLVIVYICYFTDTSMLTPWELVGFGVGFGLLMRIYKDIAIVEYKREKGID